MKSFKAVVEKIYRIQAAEAAKRRLGEAGETTVPIRAVKAVRSTRVPLGHNNPCGRNNPDGDDRACQGEVHACQDQVLAYQDRDRACQDQGRTYRGQGRACQEGDLLHGVGPGTSLRLC